MTPSAATGSFRLPSLRSVLEFDSYGGVVLLILVTYVLSINLTKYWGQSVVIVVQVATVFIILRISRAPRALRVVAAVSVVVAVAAAILAIFLHHDTADRFTPAVGSLLYLIAPISILRHLIRRTVVDQETILGAVAAYLLIGMFFAFVYRSRRRERTNGLLRSPGRRNVLPGPVLLVHHADNDWLRKPRPGIKSRPELRLGRNADWPAVPGHRGRQGHQHVPTGEEAWSCRRRTELGGARRAPDAR